MIGSTPELPCKALVECNFVDQSLAQCTKMAACKLCCRASPTGSPLGGPSTSILPTCAEKPRWPSSALHKSCEPKSKF